MNVSITRALKMPISGPNWISKVLIGAALCFVGALANNYGQLGHLVNLLVGVVTLGYCARVMCSESHTVAGSLPATLPVWSNWGELIKDGIVLTLANIVYGSVFAVLIWGISALFGVTATVTAALTAGSLAGLASAGVLWMIVVGLLGLAYTLTMPLLAAHYAHEQRLGAIIEFGTAFRKLVSHPLNVVIALVTTVCVGVLAVLLSLTIVGIPFAAFLAQVTIANVWGQVYRLG